MGERRKTALITGASRGLGLALARELAGRGWALIIDARGHAALEAARAELAAVTQVTAIAGDIADPAHRAALADAAAAGIDAIVNNASVLGPSPQPALLDYPLDTLEHVYAVNVLGPLGLIQAIHARDALAADGCIINVTSDAAVEAYEGWGGYGSSKAALEQMTAVLAAELPGVRVYRVDPGDMNTQMQQDAFPGEDISDRPPPQVSVPGIVELIEGRLPSGRYAARDVQPAGIGR
jgi:NAD(P)-dependent dehydrogenase (short-subunit alcohol dehydrogenase family)